MSGCGGHRSPSLGRPAVLRFEIVGPCSMPDDIPSPSASLNSGKLGRRPPRVKLPSRRQIKIRESEHPYAIPALSPFKHTYKQYRQVRGHRPISHVVASTQKTAPYLHRLLAPIGQCKFSPSLSSYSTSLSAHLPPSFSAPTLHEHTSST
jgi:hypothetical protein